MPGEKRRFFIFGKKAPFFGILAGGEGLWPLRPPPWICSWGAAGQFRAPWVKQGALFGDFWEKDTLFWRSGGRGEGPRPLRPPPWIRPWRACSGANLTAFQLGGWGKY